MKKNQIIFENISIFHFRNFLGKNDPGTSRFLKEYSGQEKLLISS